MRRALCLLLIVATPATALGDPPVDAPLDDVAGVSVLLHKGEPAPFDGRELSLDESLRRGKQLAQCKGTLQDAQDNGVLLPKAAVAALIGGAAAAVVTSLTLGALAAAHKL